MKKLLGILVLGLLWCNYSFAETIVKLPKDTASRYKKLFKSLTGKYYKDNRKRFELFSSLSRNCVIL